MDHQACTTNYDNGGPFGSIEDAQEYLALLAQTVSEAQHAVDSDISVNEAALQNTQQVRAIRIISYNLDKLGEHIKTSRRILNDLRTLRRLLYQSSSKVEGSSSIVAVLSDSAVR